MGNYDSLIKELATSINKMVNLPLVNEQNEQAIFELVLNILVGMFIDELDDLAELMQ